MKGIVRRLVPEKFFGFIRAEEGGDYFFHKSDCWDNFDEFQVGNEVEFSPTKTKKGLRAMEVRANTNGGDMGRYS